MLKIKCFTLDNQQNTLLVELASDDKQLSQAWTFSFEFLRVVSLSAISGAGASSKAQVTAHKKQVKLMLIESVGKHGYRFCFDDGFSVIYDKNQLSLLHQQSQSLWESYLAALKKSGHTREATIDLKQL